jgi:hypothetical protein
MKPSAKRVAAVYAGNLGFVELIKFYEVASERDTKRMQFLLETDKLKQAWELSKRVTGVRLKA